MESLTNTVYYGIDPGASGGIVGIMLKHNPILHLNIEINKERYFPVILMAQKFSKPKQKYFTNWLDGGLLDVIKTNSYVCNYLNDIRMVLNNYDIAINTSHFVEYPLLMPGMGIQSTFKNGVNYGILLNAIVTHLSTVSFVYPQEWTNHLKSILPLELKNILLDEIKKTKNKKLLGKLYWELFSPLSYDNKFIDIKANDGIYDAFCIALYGAIHQHNAILTKGLL